MITAIDRVKASKRKAKAQRDNLKQRAMNDRKLIADYCWEKRGHFASDAAAKCFAELVLLGCWETPATGGEKGMDA
jgi:hypothetical protein